MYIHEYNRQVKRIKMYREEANMFLAQANDPALDSEQQETAYSLFQMYTEWAQDLSDKLEEVELHEAFAL